MSNLITSVLCAVLFCFLVGCNEMNQEVKSESSEEATAQALSEKTTPAESRVAQIVFIGQKEACPCTRKRIDEAWPVLEKVLKGYEGIAVKRIQNDVEVDEADKYDDMKTVMVAPGIFFFDKDEKLVDMVQGAVTESQIATVLKK